ncbi:MAG: hypothetical protein IKN12_01700 [Selenomonadaceae bacterium]|nr:hypothetical protein [Selenomonadaceae bacterium]
MKLHYKVIAAIGAISVFSCVLSVSEAAKIDAYKNILLSKSYTIKYDNITPPRRLTNRDKTPLFGNSGMAVDKNDYLTNRQRSGVVTSDGQNRYEEVGDGTFSQCRLIKGNEVFNFTKYPQKDNPKLFEFMGVKKNRVEAMKRNYLAEAIEGESFGDTEATRLLNSILSKNGKAVYSYVGSGSLSGGLSYEDYKSSSGGVTGVIRYYFNGNSLVKIASAEYYKSASGAMEGFKTIVKINEFTASPETNLLKLPEGLKDTTKRKDKE